MFTILRGITASLIAVMLAAHVAGAQTVIINDQPVQEHFTFEGTSYVSLEVLLRALRFDWSLSGRDLVLREGSGQGPRIVAEDLSIKLGDRTMDVSGIQRRGTTYVPLLAVVSHLGYRAVPDARANTLTVVAGGEGQAQRVRIGREARDQAPERIRVGEPRQPPPAVRPPAQAAHPAESVFEDACEVDQPGDPFGPLEPAAILESVRPILRLPPQPRGREVTIGDLARQLSEPLGIPVAAPTPDQEQRMIRIRRRGAAPRPERAVMAEQLAIQVGAAPAVHMIDQLTLPGGYFYTRKGTAELSRVWANTNWRKTWHIIVPGRFRFTPGTDLLFYDRLTGDAGIYSNDGKGNFSLLKAHPNLGTNWDIIVPGRFSEGVHALFTDLFLYDRQNRTARFYRTDGNGNIDLLKQHTGMQDWDIIVPGDWGGSHHTDLFFYSRRRGEARIYRTDGNGNLQLLRSHNVRRSWDVIVPGRFGGGDRTDLLFYRRVIGDAQIYSVDANGNMSLMREHTGWRTTWDVIVPGEFGGSGRTDLFMYDRRAGVAAFAHGGAQGAISMQPLQTSLRSTWFSIVPGEFGFTSGTDLLFYDNHYRIPIQAIRVADTDGSRAASVTPAQVQQWLKRANEVFNDAGVVFTFDPEKDWRTINSTVLNNLGTEKTYKDNDLEMDDFELARAAANFVSYFYPGKIVVYFRHGPLVNATGGGFSSMNASYVAMPGFSTSRLPLLAHELGHYLGTPHPFAVQLKDRNDDGVVDHADLLHWLSGKSGLLSSLLDGDRNWVRDTPPDIGRFIFIDAGLQPGDRDAVMTVQWQGQSFTFSPDWHNVMAYGAFDDYQRILPDQVRRIREWLHEDHREHLIEGQ